MEQFEVFHNSKEFLVATVLLSLVLQACEEASYGMRHKMEHGEQQG